MASSSGTTALLITLVGVGGYALYRWWEREGGHMGHSGHPHAPPHPAARGYFTGYDDFVGRGGPMHGHGGMHGHHFDSMQQQQMQQQQMQQQMPDGEGDTDGGMQPPQQFAQHPSFGQQHSFAHHGFGGHGRR